jgi:hypothetical protein
VVRSVWQTFQFPERDAIKELYPHFHHKTDKMGRPVYIERLGQLQVDELLKVTTMDRMLLYHVKEWEILIDWKIPACSKKAGTNISQTLTILDMKGVVMFHQDPFGPFLVCVLMYLETFPVSSEDILMMDSAWNISSLVCLALFFCF